MDIKDLEALGFSKEDVFNRVVDQISERLLTEEVFDPEYGDVDYGETTFAKSVRAEISEKIDAAVAKVAEKHTLPNITEYLENLCIQKTNTWGERKGEEVTFIEYLTHCAETFLTEKVDYKGNPKGSSGGWGSWKENGTRVSYLVNEHLQYSVSTAITKALKDINGQIAQGLDGVVKIQLQQALDGLKVSTTVKS